MKSSLPRTVDPRVSKHQNRTSIGNAIYSVSDYIAQPLAMIFAAPFLVHRLGLSQYGLWMLVTAVLGSVGVLSSGFGDATIKFVSAYRGRGDHAGVINSIRGAITINLTLGGVFAALIWLLTPYAVQHVFKIEPAFERASVIALRISSFVLVVRSIESVFASALRAFEKYGPPARLNIVSRTGVILAAVVLTSLGHGVAAILAATLVISSLTASLQALALRTVVGPMLLLPHFGREVLSELAGFGIFTWLQGLSAVAFTHADRLLVGAMLGTSTLAIYTICVQAAQPIHGLIAAALNFLFPHISSRHEAGERASSRQLFRLAMPLNALMAASLSVPLIFFSRRLLTLWMGVAFARAGHSLLSLLAVSFGLLALTVVPHYTLLALGRVRFVSTLNVATGLVLLLLMSVILPGTGMIGAGVCRVLYGGFLSILYVNKALHSVRVVEASSKSESAPFSDARPDVAV
jgi:O-antigen/teichoic acid export membrane protein